MSRSARIRGGVTPLLDLMQTIPTFVYLIPALILFGLGMVPGLIATVIFAIAAPIRLTRLGIISTPPSLVEAAVAFGNFQAQLADLPGGRLEADDADAAAAAVRIALS